MRPKTRPKALRVKVFDHNYGFRMYGITDIRNYGCTELRMTVITTEVRETSQRCAREKRTDVQTVRENLKLNTSKLFKPGFPVEFQRLSGRLKSGPA